MDQRRDRSPRGRSTAADSRSFRLRGRSLPARNSPVAHRPVSRPRPLPGVARYHEYHCHSRLHHSLRFSLSSVGNQLTNLSPCLHRRTTLSTFSGRCCKPRPDFAAHRDGEDTRRCECYCDQCCVQCSSSWHKYNFTFGAREFWALSEWMRTGL